jgi:hypothetical protein
MKSDSEVRYRYGYTLACLQCGRVSAYDPELHEIPGIQRCSDCQDYCILVYDRLPNPTIDTADVL